MLILVVTATWWLLVGKSVALPTSVYGTNSSSAASAVISRDLGSRSTADNETFSSSLSKDNSISAFVDSTNSTAEKTSIDNPSVTTPSSSTSPHNWIDTANAVPVTSSSTASGYSTSSSSPTTSTAAPDYALSFADMVSAIATEFVCNVAGDHVLFPVDEDRDEDQRLHTNAVIVAALLQKLHITPEVYQILNTTICAVAKDMKRVGTRGANPVAKVMQLTIEAAARNPLLRDEYLAVKQRLANQIYTLPSQHGKFASIKSQTLYDVTAEQQAYIAKLMEDASVKKVLMSVIFFKASQFEETSVPEWVRSQTRLARAVFKLAKQPKWRDEVQRAFDEAVTEILEKFDAIAEDEQLIFQTVREKVEKNAPLYAELEKMGNRLAQTKT